MDFLCENCRWFMCDEDSGEEFCNALLDEDEYAQLTQSLRRGKCRYFCPDGGEYEIVRRQN